MHKSLILLSVFLIACASTWKDKVYKKDKEFILKGRYSYQAFSLGRKGGEYEDVIENLRDEIEKDPEIFDIIVETYFEIYHPPFRYHITMIDRERNKLIIRYFARFLRRKIYAGIGVQFVYSLKDKKMEKVYVDLIPLE